MKYFGYLENLQNMASDMASVLQKLNLGNYVQMFNAEKITPNIVGKLPLADFKELGMQSRKDIMSLRLECVKYGSKIPQRNRIGCGAPQLNLIFPSQFWKVTWIKILR